MGAAWRVRYVLLPGRETPGSLALAMGWAAAFSPVLAVLYGMLGVYVPRAEKSCLRTLRRIILANALVVMLFIDVIYCFRVTDISRWMLAFFTCPTALYGIKYWVNTFSS